MGSMVVVERIEKTERIVREKFPHYLSFYPISLLRGVLFCSMSSSIMDGDRILDIWSMTAFMWQLIASIAWSTSIFFSSRRMYMVTIDVSDCRPPGPAGIMAKPEGLKNKLFLQNLGKREIWTSASVISDDRMKEQYSFSVDSCRKKLWPCHVKGT